MNSLNALPSDKTQSRLKRSGTDFKILDETPAFEWPQDAAQKILEALADQRMDPSDRLLAAKLAGSSDLVTDDLADALLAVVANPEEAEQLRACAATSLGPILQYADEEGFEEFGDPPIYLDTFDKLVESLQGVYVDRDTPKLVRRRVLEASVRSPQDWHREAISWAYSQNDSDWRLTAIFSMGWVDGFDDQILEALESDDEASHREAVHAAGEQGLDQAWSYVVGLVNAKDTDKDLLLTAVLAAGNIRSDGAAAALAHLADSEDEDIRDAVAEALVLNEGVYVDGEEIF